MKPLHKGKRRNHVVAAGLRQNWNCLKQESDPFLPQEENPSTHHRILTITNQVVKELQFDEEKLITDESPLETLHLKQSIEDVITDINSAISTIPVMMFTTYVESKTGYATHPCSDALSLLLGNM